MLGLGTRLRLFVVRLAVYENAYIAVEMLVIDDLNTI